MRPPRGSYDVLRPLIAGGQFREPGGWYIQGAQGQKLWCLMFYAKFQVYWIILISSNLWGAPRGGNGRPPRGRMIYSRGPWPKALVPDVPCKISGILNHFHKFKSQGGPLGGPQGGQWKAPHGLHDIFKGPRPKALVYDVLCKRSWRLKHWSVRYVLKCFPNTS